MKDGGDAARFWAASGEAGPLTGGIWGAPMGAEALSAGEIGADGVVAVGDAIAADEPASMSDHAQTGASMLVNRIRMAKTALLLVVFLRLRSPFTCGRCPTCRPKTLCK
jgi:hypothetical protein